MAHRVAMEIVKTMLRCCICNKVIGYTPSFDEWVKVHYCDDKKCKKQEMLDKLNG